MARMTLRHCGLTATSVLRLVSVGCGLLLSACGRQNTDAEKTPAISSQRAALTVQPASPSELGEVGGEAAEASDLRRGYGMVDMRFNSCVKLENGTTFVGNGCASGFVIYGPYVPVPRNSEIEVSFEVKPSRRIEVYADVVSQMGTHTLAGLSRQVVEAGSRHKLGYRVHVSNADTNVESRIGMTVEPDVKFEISNLTMTVR
jgi:hypothetical protein